MSSYSYGHTHITSPNAEKAVEFYTQVMGAKVIQVHEGGGSKMVEIDLGGTPVRITSGTGVDDVWPGPRYGIHHICLNVDNMEEFTAKLKSNGVEFVIEPHQHKPGVKLAFAKSPDNVLFEIAEVKES